MQDQVKITCYGLRGVRTTIEVPADQIKSTNRQWLAWKGERVLKERMGQFIPLRDAEIGK